MPRLGGDVEVAVVEVPLLFECEMAAVFDTTVAVVTSDEVRRARAEARGHALVGEREARQLPRRRRRPGPSTWSRTTARSRTSSERLSALVAKLEEMKKAPRTQASPGDRRGGARRRSPRCVLLGVAGTIDKAIQELTLPLKHEDVIRQQSREKGVDAALIAAVIYSESKFSDRTSSAGARGLMQITPEAAKEIERHSGGTTFKLNDLSDPEINIRYGTFLLRELLDRYDGDEVAALAAYNAGPGNADRWGGSELTVAGIPFPETRAYVEEVLEKQRDYREKYPRELGYR